MRTKIISATIEINGEIDKPSVTITLDNGKVLSANNIENKEIIYKGLDIIRDISNLLHNIILPNFNEKGLDSIKNEILNE